MATKKAKKKVTAQKFYAVRLYKDGEVNIYKTSVRPTVVPIDFEVQGAKGVALYPLLDLCSTTDPLFKDLAVGEAKEVTVNLG